VTTYYLYIVTCYEVLGCINWLFNLSILSVPDEDYSRNASCALYLISTFLLIVNSVFFHQ